MTQITVRKTRRPAIAAILALLAPGLGHLYSGQLPRAVAAALVFLFFTNGFFLILVNPSLEQLTILMFFAAGCLLYLVHAIFAWRTASRQCRDFVLRPYNQWYHYVLWWLSATFLVLFTMLLLGDYRGFRSPSSSMERSLLLDERFLADMSAYETNDPVRGDAVIFICPCDSTTLYFKRCLGLPGDTIAIVNKKLVINGIEFAEPATLQFIDTTVNGELIIHPRLSAGVDSRDNYGPYQVPKGQFFMIGDNRDNSYDSRYFGFVPKSMILGKAVRIYYSRDWSRIGRRVALSE